eukprot:gene8689-10209_t
MYRSYDRSWFEFDGLEKIDTVTSGLTTLDGALGIGGLPKRHITEICGEPSTGKSTLSLHMVARALGQSPGSMALIVDSENSFTSSWARTLGVDLDRCYLAQPKYAEDTVAIVQQSLDRNLFSMIVIDTPSAWLHDALDRIHSQLASSECAVIDYAFIAIQPDAVLDFTADGFPKFLFYKTAKYTVSYGPSADCVRNHTVDVSTPTPVIQPPLCPYSETTITSFGITCQRFQFKGKDVTLPTTYHQDGQSHTLTCANQPTEQAESSCSLPVYSSPATQFIPAFQVTSAQCSSATGSIHVLNPDSYTKITLSLGGETLPSQSSGQFNNLPRGGYTLTITSSTCGVQSIPVIVESVSPTIVLTHSNQCPGKFLVNATLSGFSSDVSPLFTVNNNEPQASPLLLVPDEVNTIQYTSFGCNSRINVTVPQYYSQCFYRSYRITPKRPMPVIVEDIVVNGTPMSCMQNISITIPNHMDFKDITLQLDDGTDAIRPFSSPDIYGRILNIARSRYLIRYTSIDSNGAACGEPSTHRFSLNHEPVAKDSISFRFKGFPKENAPICGEESGQGIFSVTGPLGDEDITITYTPGVPTQVDLPFSYCRDSVTFTPEATEFPVRNMTFTVGKASQCIYENGSISVEGGEFSAVFIDGHSYPTSSPYSVARGRHTLKIVTSNGARPQSPCILEQVIDIPVTNPDFRFKFNITKSIDDCSRNTGALQVENPEQYTSMTLDGSRGSEGGLFSSMSGGDHTIEFVTEQCSGSASVFIETLVTDFKVSTVQLRPPTCDSGDGVYTFQLTDKAGTKQLDITGIVYNGIDFEDLIVRSVLPGTQTFNIKNPFEFTILNKDSCVQQPAVQVKPSKFVSITSLGDLTKGVDIITNLAYGQSTIEIAWNEVCKKTFTINSPYPNSTVQPTVEIVQASCGNFDSKIVVANHDKFHRLSFGNLAITNETCHGSFDGLVESRLTDSTLQVMDTDDFEERVDPQFIIPEVSFAPHLTKTSYQLGSGEYMMLESTPGNPFCVHSTLFKVDGGEPSLVSTTAGVCSLDDTVPIVPLFGVKITNFTMTIDGAQVTGPAPLLKQGNYSVQINITEPLCRRVLPATFFSVKDQSLTNVAVDTESSCESVTVVIADQLVTGIQIELTDKDNTITGDLDQKTIQDVPSGNYTLVLKSTTSQCSLTRQIEIKKCSNKKSMSWIAGLVIGILAAAIIGALIFWFIRRKRNNNKMLEDQLKMKTVPIYSGVGWPMQITGVNDPDPMFSVNGLPLSRSPVRLSQDYSPNTITYSANGCTTSLPIDIPSTIIDVKWSHAVTNQCDDATLVTLKYPTFVLSVVTSNNSSVELGDGGTTFLASFNTDYMVSSSCNGKSQTIRVERQRPIIIQDTQPTGTTCLDNYQVIKDISMDNNGRFSNVQLLDYTVVYTPLVNGSVCGTSSEFILPIKHTPITDLSIIFWRYVDSYGNNVLPKCGTRVDAEYNITHSTGDLQVTLPTDLFDLDIYLTPISSVPCKYNDAIVQVTGSYDKLYIDGVRRYNTIVTPNMPHILTFQKKNPNGNNLPLCKFSQTIPAITFTGTYQTTQSLYPQPKLNRQYVQQEPQSIFTLDGKSYTGGIVTGLKSGVSYTFGTLSSCKYTTTIVPDEYAFNVNGELSIPPTSVPTTMSFVELSTGCNGQLLVDLSREYPEIPSLPTITNEQCHGSNTGMISSPDKTIVLQVSRSEDPTQSFFPQASANIFQVSTGDYIVTQTSLSNPFCVYRSKVSVGGMEPTLSVNLDDSKIAFGLDITDISVTVNTSLCESIIVTPLSSNGAPFIVTLTNSTNYIFSYPESEFNLTNIPEGQYTLSMSATLSQRSFIQSIQVARCHYEANKSSSSLIWIIGPILGGIVLIVLIVVAIIFIRRKRSKTLKVPKPLIMRSIRVFNGGSILIDFENQKRLPISNESLRSTPYLMAMGGRLMVEQSHRLALYTMVLTTVTAQECSGIDAPSTTQGNCTFGSTLILGKLFFSEYTVTIAPSDAAGPIMVDPENMQAYIRPIKSATFTITVSKKDLSCTTVFPPIDLMVPTITLTQPLCPYSTGSIDSYGWQSQCGEGIQVDSGSYTSLPIPVRDDGSKAHSLVCNGCFVSFVNPPMYSSVPDIYVTDSMCGSEDGTVLVRNAASYTSIDLFSKDSPGSPASQSPPGNFTGLDAGDFILNVTSATCGTQLVPVTIGKRSPQIVFELSSICLDTIVNATFVGYTPSSTPSFTVYNPTESSIQSPFEFKDWGEAIEVIYEENGCFSPYMVDHPIYFSPITWSYNRSALCLGNNTVIVTLDYPADLTVNIKDYNGDVVDFEEATKSFEADYGFKYYIGSNCDLNGYEIRVESPEPTFIESPLPAGTSRSCLYNTTLTVPNYLDFEYITIDVFSSTISIDGNGQFVNIPRDNYQVLYKYVSNGVACMEGSSNINLIGGIVGSSEVTIAFDGYSEGITCDSQILSAKYNVSFNGQLSQTTVSGYTPGQDTYIPANFGSCNINVLFATPVIEIPFSPTDIYLSRNSSCLYNMGLMTIMGQGFNDKLFIDGVYSDQPDPYWYEIPLSIGTHSIEITRPSPWGICPKYRTTISNYLQGGNQDFKVDYTITPITDCSVGGSITVANPELYSLLTIKGKSFVEGVVSGLNQGTYTLDFATINAAQCGSTSSIQFVVTSTVSDYLITSSPRSIATCDKDGYYEIAITNKDKTVTLPNGGIYVNEQVDSYFEDGIVPLRSGLNTIMVMSSRCRFNSTINVELQEPIFEVTASTKTCNQLPNIKVYTKSGNIIINEARVENDTSSAVLPIFIGNPAFVNGVGVGYNIISIQWNDVCFKTINVTIDPYTPTLPDVEFIQPSCSGLNGKIVVHNYQLFRSLAISTQDTLDDKYPLLELIDGVISYPPTNNPIYLHYTELSSGCTTYLIVDVARQIPVDPNAPLSVTHETCTGSYNGCASLNTTNVLSVLEYPTNNFRSNNYHYAISSADDTFDLSAGNYIMISSTNPFCHTSTPFAIASSEPVLSITSSGACSADGSASLDISFGFETDHFASFINGIYYENGTAIPQLAPGNYSVQVNITDPVCPRRLPATFAIISDSTILATVDSSVCETITVTPLTTVGGPFQVTLTDASGNNTIHNTTTITDIVSGNYTLLLQSSSTTANGGGCSFSQQVQVTQCSDKKKKSLAWIAGLIIGVLAAALIGFIIYKLIQRKKKSRPAGPLKMNTVPIFSGGKVTKIDEF